jgi:hypothetical protein
MGLTKAAIINKKQKKLGTLLKALAHRQGSRFFSGT